MKIKCVPKEENMCALKFQLSMTLGLEQGMIKFPSFIVSLAGRD